MSRSRALFERARRVTPGGVHSPVRAFKQVGSTPVFIASAKDAELRDVDGNNYIDYCMAFGPLIFGHADTDVRLAVTEALGHGWSYGAAESISLELAETITENIDWVDSVRFVNSGTEAVMTAIRLARAVTSKSRVLKFDGCYHGHTDAMLIRAGSGLAGTSSPASAGIPANVAHDTLIAPLADLTAIETIFDAHAESIAAVIIEPLPANYGLLPQTPNFLKELAALCKKNRTLLIFDEVITGFRLSFGGFTALCDIRPDIVTWGKIIGGGFPVGAIAAKNAIMEQLAPSGPVYQAGTLSANPVAMTAGLVTLRKLLDGKHYDRLESLGRKLETAIETVDGLSLQRSGSIFWLTPQSQNTKPRTPADIPDGTECRYANMFRFLLDAGVYFPPSPYEVAFLSTAHHEAHIDALTKTLESLRT